MQVLPVYSTALHKCQLAVNTDAWTQKKKKKKNHCIFPANLGLIRCLVLHGRASCCVHSF